MSDLAEEIKIIVVLSATYWGERYPEFDITINDQVCHGGKITVVPSNKGIPNAIAQTQQVSDMTLHRVEFTTTLEPGDHVLGVVFKNKLTDDTCGFNPDGTWNRDKILHVERVELDDVDLENLIFSESTYTYADSQGQEISRPGQLSMSWNGTWALKFSTPLYIWMLERL